MQSDSGRERVANWRKLLKHEREQYMLVYEWKDVSCISCVKEYVYVSLLCMKVIAL